LVGFLGPRQRKNATLCGTCIARPDEGSHCESAFPPLDHSAERNTAFGVVQFAGRLEVSLPVVRIILRRARCRKDAGLRITLLATPFGLVVPIGFGAAGLLGLSSTGLVLPNPLSERRKHLAGTFNAVRADPGQIGGKLRSEEASIVQAVPLAPCEILTVLLASKYVKYVTLVFGALLAPTKARLEVPAASRFSVRERDRVGETSNTATRSGRKAEQDYQHRPHAACSYRVQR
jgi:hypothetical protein